MALSNLYQLKTLKRGNLNAGKTDISGTPVWQEDWNYDPTGNWRGTTSGYMTRRNRGSRGRVTFSRWHTTGHRNWKGRSKESDSADIA